MGYFIKQFYIEPRFKSFFIIVCFVGVFFLLGALGALTQSAQHGISLFWPVSGLILAAFFIYGFWLWPGVLLGFIAVALYNDVSICLCVVSGLVTILETSLAIEIARQFNFKGHLKSFKDCGIFIALIILAPIVSSAVIAVTMYLLSPDVVTPILDMMVLLWLGKSLGILLLGGTVFSFYTVDYKAESWCRINEKVALVLSIVFIFVVVSSQHSALDAALMVNFIIPVVFIGAIRFGACGATVLGLIFVILMSFFSAYSHLMMLESNNFDFQFLILVKIWFVCVSGVLIAGAFNDNLEQGRLEWLAHHDGLTGLFNRNAMNDELDLLINGARSRDDDICLLFLDVDHFKVINDQLGHKKGDEVLVKIASALTSSVRNIDVISRWGGDEFLVLLRQCNEHQAMDVSNKILKEIESLSFAENNHTYPLSVSIGVASTILGESKLRFIERADSASYEAKHNGKNRAVLA